MAITVERLGILDDIPRKIVLEAHDITVKELIDLLAINYGPCVITSLLQGDRLREGLCILLNGRSMDSLEGLGTQLHDGDDVFFTILINGG